MSAQEPCRKWRSDMCGEERTAEIYEREKKRIGNGWPQVQKVGMSWGRLRKVGRMDCRSLVSQARNWRFQCSRTSSPLVSRNLPMRFYYFIGRGRANLRSLLGRITAFRLSLQPEKTGKREKIQLFLGSLYY